MLIQIYLDPKTERRLRKISREKQMDISDLCEAAIDNEALAYFKNRKDDPA